MHTITKLVLGGTALNLLAEGLSHMALQQSSIERDPVKKLDFEQNSQAFKMLGLAGSGLFWYGCFKHSPRLTVGFGIASTVLVGSAVLAPKVIKLLDPEGWEGDRAFIRAHHRVPAPPTPVMTSGEFTGAPRRLYRARHPFDPQDQQDQQQPQHPHYHHHHHR